MTVLYTEIADSGGNNLHISSLAAPSHLKMASALAYKKNFKASAALELFYTGGPVALSPDATSVACACSDDIKIVDVETGKVTATLKGDSELVTALCFGSDGKSLLSASRSLQVRLWDISSGTCLRSWKVVWLFALFQGFFVVFLHGIDKSHQ